MNLWSKGGDADSQIAAFTVGNDRLWDEQIARWDVVGSLAHMLMLFRVGLLSEVEADQLLPALCRLHELAAAGQLQVAPTAEDIHTEVEHRLVQQVGEAGLRIHTGRSRNDQVLLDMKLWLRAELTEVGAAVATVAESLLKLSEQHASVGMPGYTHLQIAMPSTIGLWLSAYAEALSDDWPVLLAAYRLADRNPLGSAAGYGSSFPLDRDLTTRLLGFGSLHVNSLGAQLSRGKTELLAAEALASVGQTLARLCMDLCLYSGQDFGFVRLPAAFTTGSSIMPHKQNPDVFELIRGHCNRLQALPNDIRLLMANLPGGYHREYQLLKELIMPAFATMRQCLALLQHALPALEVRTDILADPKYAMLFTVEAVNRLVQQGVPFREAYRQVGQAIQAGTYQPPLPLPHTHVGSTGNLGLERIRERWQILQAELDPSPWQHTIARLLDPTETPASLLLHFGG